MITPEEAVRSLLESSRGVYKQSSSWTTGKEFKPYWYNKRYEFVLEQIPHLTKTIKPKKQ